MIPGAQVFLIAIDTTTLRVTGDTLVVGFAAGTGQVVPGVGNLRGFPFPIIVHTP